MKPGWTKLSNLWAGIIILIMASMLGACGGSSSASSSNSNGPVNIGTAPNGSAVIMSQGSFSAAQGDTTTGTVSITGGNPNTYNTISFNINANPSQLSSIKQLAADNGITITTLPSPCKVGTTGTNLPTSCQITITVASTTRPGTYIITPTAVDNTGASIDLSPITIVVSGTPIPPTPSIAITSSLPSNTIMAGQSFTITATSVNNATDTVNFANAAGTPNSITYSQASCTVAAGGSCTTTVTVGSMTPAAAADVTNITASGDTAIVPNSITFAVTRPAPSIIITGAPTESVVAGKHFTLTATSANGGADTVNFANAPGTPNSITYSQASCVVLANESCSVMATVGESTPAAPAYTIDFTPSGSTPITPESITFAVVTPQLEITVQPSPIITYAGTPESTTVTFSIDPSQIPVGVTSIPLSILSNNTSAAIVNTASCNILVSNGVVTSPCTVTVTAVAPGAGATTIQATSANYTGVTSNIITVTNVPSIAITNTLVSNSIYAGQTFTITATSVNNATSTVSFANAGGTPSSITYSPASCAVLAGESCSVTATVGLATAAASGYSTSITDTGGVAIAPSSIPFTVTQPVLTIESQPNPGIIVVGSSPSTTTVAFSISPAPKDGTISIPLTISSSNPATASVTASCNITISAGIATPCAVTVTAESASSTPVTITATNANAAGITSNSIAVHAPIIFITHNFYTGNLKDAGGGATGEAGADAICQAEAYESDSVIPSGLTFKALIVTSSRYPCDSTGNCGGSAAADWPLNAGDSYLNPDLTPFNTVNLNYVFDGSNPHFESISGSYALNGRGFWTGIQSILSNDSGTDIAGWAYADANPTQDSVTYNDYLYNCNDFTSAESDNGSNIGVTGLLPGESAPDPTPFPGSTWGNWAYLSDPSYDHQWNTWSFSAAAANTIFACAVQFRVMCVGH